MLDLTLCRARQKRFLTIQGANFDAAVIGSPKNVYYLSGYLTSWTHQSAIILFSDGRSVLYTPNSPAKEVAADDVRSFEASWLSTLRQEQAMAVKAQLIEVLVDGGAKRIGVDASEVASQLLLANLFKACPVDTQLYQQRRVKDADELALMQKAIGASEAMYTRARQIIEPGVEEMDVFNEMQATANHYLGEPMTALLGNDFVCGQGGGKPRAGRKAQAGELYVLDLGPCYRGYFADNCRTFSVDRNPTDAQHKAQRAVVGALGVVERLAKPGVKCIDLFNAVDAYLLETVGKRQTHHLGHGLGLSQHEFPHLNPKWNDTLIEGEFFTAEPGVYGPELGGGVRIENQYLVTRSGVKNLLNFPMDLV